MRPELPTECAAIVDRLLAKDPDHRFQTPRDLLQAVEQVETALGLAWRQLPAPLCWTPDTEWAEAPHLAANGVRASAPQPHARTAAVRDATLRLEAAMAHEQLERESSRRFWLATGAAAVAALAAGFALGRVRPRWPGQNRLPR